MKPKDIPVNGKRYRRMKKISQGVLCAILSCAILFLLGYGSAAVNQTVSCPLVPTETDAFTEDERPVGNEGIEGSIDEYRDFSYEKEFPIALEIYDSLFGEEEGETPAGNLKIVKTDLSKNPSAGTVYLKNNSPYDLNAADFLSADRLSLPAFGVPAAPDAPPLVLIYHTHGTEGYAEEGVTSYRKKDLPRSRDTEKNVVAVGKVLADTLNACGIPTLHLTTMFDAESYNDSYTYSNKAVRECMERFPTIKYAFDVHRDALVSDSYTYKTVTMDADKPVAQVMLVVGTDANGANHPSWRSTLAFAVDTQYLLTYRLNNLVRPICIKKASYYQQDTGLGYLIEIGTCVNTLAEAKASAAILGETLAGLILARE